MMRRSKARRNALARGVAGLLLAGPLAAGCSPADTALVMGGASLVTFIQTDRTISDHVIGAMTEKDCSTLRMITEGTSMCRDPAAAQAERAPQTAAMTSHCYRELGRVSCYDRPNPYSYRTGDDNTAQRR